MAPDAFNRTAFQLLAPPISCCPCPQVCTSVGLCPLAPTTSRRLMASPSSLLPHFLTTTTSKVQANWAQAAAAVHKRYGHEAGAALKKHPVFGKLASGSSLGGSGVDLGSGSGGSNTIGCDFCNMAVQYIKMALQNNQTTAQIEAVSDWG